MKLFTSKRVRIANMEVAKIAHLPLIRRLTHKAGRRTLACIGAGLAIMLTGSILAANKEAVAETFKVHHTIVDTVGMFIHAIGACPLLRHVEPFWTLLMGVVEAEA